MIPWIYLRLAGCRAICLHHFGCVCSYRPAEVWCHLTTWDHGSPWIGHHRFLGVSLVFCRLSGSALHPVYNTWRTFNLVGYIITWEKGLRLWYVSSYWKLYLNFVCYRLRSRGDNTFGSIRPSVCALLLEPFDLDFQHEGRPWPWLGWNCRSRS